MIKKLNCQFSDTSVPKVSTQNTLYRYDFDESHLTPVSPGPGPGAVCRR